MICGRLCNYGVHISNNQDGSSPMHLTSIYFGSPWWHTHPRDHNTTLISALTINYNFLANQFPEDESFWVVEQLASLDEPPTTCNNLSWYPSPEHNIRNSTQALTEEWECGPNCRCQLVWCGNPKLNSCNTQDWLCGGVSIVAHLLYNVGHDSFNSDKLHKDHKPCTPGLVLRWLELNFSPWSFGSCEPNNQVIQNYPAIKALRIACQGLVFIHYQVHNRYVALL